MQALLKGILRSLRDSIRDVLPIVLVVAFFELVVLKQPVPNLGRILDGAIMVVLGLALFPLGRMMAEQLTESESIYDGAAQLPASLHWTDYAWVYAFAAAIGFATTIAEPSLIAVAIKASQVSAGTITVWGLRLAVAVGVAIGIALGAFRIVTGTPLFWYIITGCVIVV